MADLKDVVAFGYYKSHTQVSVLHRNDGSKSEEDEESEMRSSSIVPG